MNDQKKRKFKGSVLFTVVFVMSILIVLLFGTLTLAYATNSRAHVNYSSAQTGITSRLVTESAIKAINGNTDYAKAVGEMGAGELNVNVSISNDKDNIGSMGHISPVTISKVGTKEYWDFQDKKWQTRDVLKFTSTVNQAGVESTSSAYVIKHYTDDVITQSKGGAGFVTTAGASLECVTSLFGGSYINLPKWDNTLDEIEFYKNLSKYSEEFTKDSTKDKKGETKIFPLYDKNNKESYFYGRNAGSEMEADITIYNNVYLANLSGVLFPDKGTGLTIFGDMVLDSDSDKFKFVAGENLGKYYKSDINGKYTSIKFNEIPYVYINGKIRREGADTYAKMTLGNTSTPFPINFFIGSADMGEKLNEFNLNNDLFLMDEDATSEFQYINKNQNALLTWVGSVINRTEPTNVRDISQKKGADICSNGNLIIKEDSHIYGDVRVKGNCEILGNNTVIEGDLVVGGSLKLADNVKINGNLYCDRTKLTTNNTDYKDSDAVLSIAQVDNLRGYYYRWELQNEKAMGSDGLYYGPTGDLIGDGIKYNDRELSECDAVIYTLQYGYKPDDVNSNDPEDLKQKIQADVAPLFENEDRYKAEDDDMAFYIETYLAETDEDGNIKEGETVKIPMNGNDIDVDKLLAKRQPAGYSKVYNSSFTVSTTIAGSSAKKPIASVEQYTSSHNGDIYPSFAKREVVLGLQASKSGVSIKDTKIVKTLKEILESGVDPYKYSDPATIPGNFKSEYDKAIKPENTYSTIGEMENGMKKYVKGNIDVTNPISSIEKTTIESEKSSNAYYINKSCHLKFADCDKTIVIDPGSSEIVVVIDDLTFPKKDNIILVDDTASTPGTVDLYINKRLYHNGVDNNVPIYTTLTYQQKLTDSNIKSGKINSSDDKVVDFDMGALDKPKLNIYGAKDSLLEVANFSYMVGNIISPELTVRLKAQNQKCGLTKFYYNNEDVLDPQAGEKTNNLFVFGCLNAKDVEMENVINVIYVPDKKGKGGGADAEDKDYKYYVLYYSDN